MVEEVVEGTQGFGGCREGGTYMQTFLLRGGLIQVYFCYVAKALFTHCDDLMRNNSTKVVVRSMSSR